jgi:hypothetical protein
MELKRILKLKKSGGIAKKSDFPNSFAELKEKAKEFVPINEGIQKYQFIEENANREIRHQEDFDLMNKEYEKEKIIKISVNVIDKPLDEQNLSFSNVSCKKSEEEVISINNNIDLGDIKIEEPEEKMKREIQEIVNNKMKNLEENIAQDIFQSIKTQLSKNEQNILNEKNSNKIIHIYKCNNCGKENIEGIRYKCTNCPDYNLCEKCESNSEHIPSHILLKIRRPIQDKNLNYKIKNFTYKNSVFNYSINEKTFIFSFSDKENDNLVRQISLTNSGFEEWQSGNVFKCLPDSELKGKDYKIEQGLNINETINIEIIFQDFKKDLNTFKDEYDVYYQMFNGNEEAFGNITHFKVIFKE